MSTQPADGSDLLVKKKNLRDTRFKHSPIPSKGALNDNQLLLKVDLFSFTSNNITYAAVGETMRYWDFFPAEDGWGKVPCWGFADVIVSNQDDIAEGERLYGYFPMSTHLVVEAGRSNPIGFYDVSPHRATLPIVYNHYIRVKNDPGYKKEYEAHHSIFQPLFATSFLLDDYLHERSFFDAENIIATSASSKTAIAFAFLLHRHKEDRNINYRITGLTSERNLEFVKGLGIYDQVFTYDQLDLLDDNSTSMVVDFAGNKELLMALQKTLPDGLKYFCNVGLSHWEDSSGPGSLHVANEFFFAPTHAEKRTHEWGGAGLRDKMAEVYVPFLEFSKDWMKIRSAHGEEAVQEVYVKMVDGQVDPSEGIILSMH